MLEKEKALSLQEQFCSQMYANEKYLASSYGRFVRLFYGALLSEF